MSGRTTTMPAGPLPARAPVLVAHPLLDQLARFAVASGLGTAFNIAIYLTTRTWWDAVPANLIALILSTALSTELNRRFTFGHTGARRFAYYFQTVATVVFYAFYSTAVLLVLHASVTSTVPVEESAAVTAASLIGGGLRFVILRRWGLRPAARAGGVSRFTSPQRPRPTHRPTRPGGATGRPDRTPGNEGLRSREESVTR